MTAVRRLFGTGCLGLCAICLWLAPASDSTADPLGTAMEQMQIIVPKTRLPAPDFHLTDIEGHQVRLSDYAGQVVLLNFWATWCSPCLEEMPGMQTLWDQFHDKGLAVVAISADTDIGAVKTFIRKMALTYPVLLDTDNSVQSEYEVVAVPMTYLIGGDGKFAGLAMGTRDWASPEAFNLIKMLQQQFPPDIQPDKTVRFMSP